MMKSDGEHQSVLVKEEFLSVSDLNGLIRDCLQIGFSNAVWVCGEIQGYDRNRGRKHVFFELCEKDPETKDVIARIGLVVFAGKRTAIDATLRQAQNGFELKDDIEVKFHCRVDFYPPHGAVRLVVEAIDPVYTLGKIAQEKQKLIAKLDAAGILQKNKTLTLPEVPLKIGLITADDSAAYNDFIHELKNSGYAFEVFFRPAVMQGRNSEQDICQALNELEKLKSLDAIVITRGGGSIADLSSFDSEQIARRIAAAQRPVLSGIGHEINITVTDLASHTHQKTPTAIACFLVLQIEQYLEHIDERMNLIINQAEDILMAEQQRLKQQAMDLQAASLNFFRTHHELFARYQDVLLRGPQRMIQSCKEHSQRRQDELLRTVKTFVLRRHEQINHIQRMVDIAHPKNTLRRGFTITRKEDGQLIRGKNDVAGGDILITETTDGQFRVRAE